MKGNLLLVDDEPLILKNLKFNLEDYAENIFTAENGLIALDVLAEQNIQCVVCDINMPKMNGVEVIKAIREKGNNVPFIFYTAHGNHELMMEVAQYGAFDFLNKPDLTGLEDSVIKGLKEGVSREQGSASSEAIKPGEVEDILLSLDED
ncbi:MAG: hypothetical protein CME62_14705 [Halobacteriovoraceae bacterium]|nr:hypothetical protein [Halobacteriovoraceae bacterium]|tara:strand:+ start:9233 stop:9679 length:447 start_codon:yes stop_codon:yes gene_type:complete